MNSGCINFAIVGAGMIAGFHANAINSIDNAKLAGVCDYNFDSAQKFAEKYGIKAYTDYEEILADEKIDAVCICTPSGYHAEQAIKALEHKKHVALEKPMSLTVCEADKIIDACKKNDRKLTVISQLRFSEDIMEIKKLVSEEAFGTISMVDLYMKYWREPSYYSSSAWRGTKAFDGGGALINQGIHGVDLLLYIAGDANLVHSKVKTCVHDIEVEDTAVAMLEFKNGAVGVIEASTCAYPGFERRIEIVGSTGSAILKENAIEKLVLDGKTVIDKTGEPSKVASSSDPAAMSYDMHARQLRNFVNAINGSEKLLVSAEEGKKALQLIENVYNFPLEGDRCETV